MSDLEIVLDACESTASWGGISIKSVSDQNIFGDTPLHTVCTWGDLDSARVLLNAGANANARGDHGATPIFNAVMSDNADLVQMLLVCGADRSVKIFGSASLADFAKDIGASREILAMLVR